MQADLRRLALGTALTSTLIVASLLSVSLARAAEECGPLAPTVTCTSTSGVGNPYPDGIEYSPAGDFTLIVDPTVVIDTTGSGMNGISIPDFGDPLPNGDIVVDTAPGSSITADGSGVYVAVESGSITIANDAEITAGDFGIEAKTYGSNSGIQIDNDGYITAALNDPSDPPSGADGIYAFTEGTNSPISIKNAGNIEVSGAFVPASPNNAASAGVYDGIYAVSVGGDSPITVINSGDITTAFGEAIDIRTYGGTAPVPIPPDQPVPDNLKVGPANSPVTIINHGNIYSDDDGIEICTAGLRNTNCRGGGGNSPVLLKNYGNITAAYVALDAVTYGPNSPITFYNTGDVETGEESLDAETSGDGSSIVIKNRGGVAAEIDGISAATSAYAQGNNSPITIVNSGDIEAGEQGIYASTGQNFPSDGSPVSIYTSGTVVAGYNGVYAHTDGADSPIEIVNTGDITGGDVDAYGETFAGIYATTDGDSEITIINYGSVTAESLLAIDTEGGATTIVNKGTVTGFVDLTEEDDVFENAGTFEAQEESDFGDGDDLFINEGTGTRQPSIRMSKRRPASSVLSSSRIRDLSAWWMEQRATASRSPAISRP